MHHRVRFVQVTFLAWKPGPVSHSLRQDAGNLEEGQLPARCRRQLPRCWRAGFVERAENVRSWSAGTSKTQLSLCAWDGNSIVRRGRDDLFHTDIQAGAATPDGQEGTCAWMDCSRSWTASRSSSWTTWGMCSSRARRWKCSSPFWRSDTSGGRAGEAAIWSLKVGQFFKDPMTTMAAVDRLVQITPSFWSSTAKSMRVPRGRKERQLTRTAPPEAATHAKRPWRSAKPPKPISERQGESCCSEGESPSGLAESRRNLVTKGTSMERLTNRPNPSVACNRKEPESPG